MIFLQNFIGGFMILIAVVNIQEGILGSLLFAVIALIVIPKSRKYINDHTSLRLVGRRIAFAIVGILFIFGLVASKSSTTNEIQPDVSVEDTHVQQETTTVTTLSDVIATDNTTTQTNLVGTQNTNYDVVKVIDGDTVILNINGVNQTVRLIGINTPETVDPRKDVECFGVEASNKAKEILTNQKVAIESDSSQGDKDKYNRLLRYVVLSNGTNFGKMMIQEGYAYEYTYDTAYKYQSEFKQAQTEAQNAQRGLWSPSACVKKQEVNQDSATVQPTHQNNTSVTPQVTNTAQDQNESKYICSVDTYNCSDFTKYNDALDVYLQCGGVGKDIHKLDGDHDGEPCESLR